jgi:hypothetical protein
VTPAQSASSRHEEAHVDGALVEMGEVDPDRRARPATPAAEGRQVDTGARGAEAARLHLEAEAPAHRGSAPLEFVDREVDTLAEERPERPLDVLLLHEPPEVGVLAADVRQEPPVRAVRIAVDGAPDDGQEGLGAVLDAPSENPVGLFRADRPPEKGRQAPD